MNYKIIVKCVKKREPYIEYLRNHLPEDTIYCYDKTKNAMDTFLEALKLAKSYPCLHLEDDVILCDNFLDKVSVEIDKRPNEVIQFFSRRKDDILIGSRYCSGGSFMCSVCFYLPMGLSKELLEYYESWKVYDSGKNPTGTDLFVAWVLRKKKMRYWIVVPNLVDHRVGRSSINPRRSSKRQSRTFGVTDLEKLKRDFLKERSVKIWKRKRIRKKRKR